MAAVAIIRLEHDAAWLRRVTSRSSDSDAARRMLALSFALERAPLKRMLRSYVPVLPAARVVVNDLPGQKIIRQQQQQPPGLAATQDIEMALTSSRDVARRGRPPGLASGTSSAMADHCPSVRLAG